MRKAVHLSNTVIADLDYNFCPDAPAEDILAYQETVKPSKPDGDQVLGDKKYRYRAAIAKINIICLNIPTATNYFSITGTELITLRAELAGLDQAALGISPVPMREIANEF